MAESSNVIIHKMLLVGGSGQSAELKQDFGKFEMIEDISTTTISALLVFSETESLRETLPIIGEELVIVEFQSISPISKAPDAMIKLVFFVTKMIDFTIDGDKKRSYGLVLNTMDHRLNFKQRIRKSYTGNASGITNRVITNMLSAPLIDVDADKFTNDYIFPNWRPFQVINYLSNNAVSAQYNDPYYKFYQDRRGFNFVSMSYMMDRTQGLILNNKILNVKDNDTDEKNVHSFTNRKMFDTDENILYGMYGATLISYDKINKSHRETKNTYTQTFGQFKHVGEKKLTSAFLESPKYNFQFMLDNEPTSPGVYNYVDDIHKQRIIRGNQHNNHNWEVTYTADTNILVGRYCIFNLRSPLTEVFDKKLSGKYLIKTIKMSMTQSNLYMYLTVSKDGVFS